MTRMNKVARTAAMIMIGAMFASGVKTAIASDNGASSVTQLSVTEQLVARILN